ncbi:MFS transporter [Sutterella sp.]|uniref:MFS transporter n=1 Tax=Sutterella sp. TaxID=1981025 RepID=UPI0026E10FDD|nr:MFS transporter [Sutterella sp.]MDO5532743.1 MFS transporter [Sutterella sp.]
MAQAAFPRRGFTFCTAAAALICCFIFSSAPIPLIGVWSAKVGLGTGEVALSVLSYFGGSVVTLICLARLSNAFGRRRVTLGMLAGAAAACLILAGLDSAGKFYAARFIQGLASGLASSAVMSWVVDSTPPRVAWLGAGLTAAGPNVGFALGTFLSGVIISLGFVGVDELLLGCALVCVPLAAAVLFSTETVPGGTESLLSAVKPKFALPRRLRRIFVMVAFSLFGTWGIGSFLQGFSAKLALDVLGSTSTLVAASVYLWLIIPNAVFGVIAGKLSPARWFPVSVTCYTVCGALLFLAIETACIPLFILALLGAGVTSGMTCTLGMKFLLVDTALRERAGLIGALYLTCNLGAGVPNLLVGEFAGGLTETALHLGYVLWVLLSWLGATALYVLIRRRPNGAEALRFR